MISHEFEARHFPGQKQHDIAFALGIPMPPRLLTTAATAGGTFRRLYAMYRREMELGIVQVMEIRRYRGGVSL